MRLPQLSLPWAILASVVIVAIVVLLALHIVSWPVLAAFLGGVVIPAVRSSETGPRMPPPLPVLALLAFAGLLVVACAPQTVAKDEYSAGLKACDDTSASRAEDDACKARWRAKWDEAGAPPAAILDGGVQ